MNSVDVYDDTSIPIFARDARVFFTSCGHGTRA